MKFDELKEKLKSYEWKKLLSSRNFIILGCVLVIGAGVIVTSVLSAASLQQATTAVRRYSATPYLSATKAAARRHRQEKTLRKMTAISP